MEPQFEPLSIEHARPVMDIFNHYVENSFAAYPDQRLPDEFFGRFLEMAKGYPAYAIKNNSGTVIGFCMLRSYNPFPVFRRTAEISYFLAPDVTGQGIGKAALTLLEEGGKAGGIQILLAEISSLNESSIEFHQRNGFTECGRIKKAGRKKETDFDLVWMEKELR